MHVDVRFTRTSKIADYFIQIRPGTDIAFLGAIINYVIQNKKYDEQYLRLHTERYSFEVVSSITGASVADIKMAAEIYSSIKPAVFMYALGMTQHTVGVENIRCFTVLQLLRGNIGLPGGGLRNARATQRSSLNRLWNYVPIFSRLFAVADRKN